MNLNYNPCKIKFSVRSAEGEGVLFCVAFFSKSSPYLYGPAE